VHENSLAKAVGRLRRALGAAGDSLETLYGRGYRFNGTPVRVDPRAEERVGAIDAAASTRNSARRLGVLAGAAAVAALAGVGLPYLWSRPDAAQGQDFRRAPPLTADVPDSLGTILWVDDHPQNNIYETRFFEARRITVHATRTSADALRLLSMYDYDLVISDMGRGEDRLAGLKLVEQLRALGDDTPLVIYTVRPEGEEQQRAQRRLVADAGAQGVVVTPEEVRTAILRYFGNPPMRGPD
jgi:CheY-like chemotaxis protein